MEGRVQYRNELSERFKICTGVQQGSVEGPALFILYLAALTEIAFPHDSVYQRELGVEILVEDGDIMNAKRFQNPRLHKVLDSTYADNTALFANSHSAMNRTIQRFAQVSQEFGMVKN